jgi:membrane associated rhomboid family serine protease
MNLWAFLEKIPGKERLFAIVVMCMTVVVLCWICADTRSHILAVASPLLSAAIGYYFGASKKAKE